MRNQITHVLIATAAACLCGQAGSAPLTSRSTTKQADVVYLSDLNPIAVNDLPYSAGSKALLAGICKMDGTTFAHSVSFRSRGVFKDSDGHVWDKGSVTYDLKGAFEGFEAEVGLEDSKHFHGVPIRVKLARDGQWEPATAETMEGQQPIHVSVSVRGVKQLTLLIESRGFSFETGMLWCGNAKLVRPQRTVMPQPKLESPQLPAGDASTIGQPPGAKLISTNPDQLQPVVDAIQTEAKELFGASKKPSLAIAAIRLISRPGEALAPENAENLREDLRTGLVNTKMFTVLERGQLDEVLRQNRIELKDTFDSETAKRLGKLLKADLFLIGSLSDRGPSVVINISVIDSITGAAAIAKSVTLSASSTSSSSGAG
jgi:hypothetical protein